MFTLNGVNSYMMLHNELHYEYCNVRNTILCLYKFQWRSIQES